MLKSTNRLLGSYLISFKSFHAKFILFILILIFTVLIFPSVSFADSGWYFNYNYVNIRSYTLNGSDIVVGQIEARSPSSCYDCPYLNNNTAAIYEYGTNNVFPTCDGIIPPICLLVGFYGNKYSRFGNVRFYGSYLRVGLCRWFFNLVYYFIDSACGMAL